MNYAPQQFPIYAPYQLPGEFADVAFEFYAVSLSRRDCAPHQLPGEFAGVAFEVCAASLSRRVCAPHLLQGEFGSAWH